MRKSLLAFSMPISLFAGAVVARAQNASVQDKQFVAEATSGGMLEVRLGEYASFNAANEKVRKFGEHMAGDHSQANEKLKPLAYDKGIEMPKQLDPQDQQVLDRLEKLKGAEFDKAYMAQMVDDHEKDIAAFEKEIESGSEPEVKAFAETVLPKLKLHLQTARAIE